MKRSNVQQFIAILGSAAMLTISPSVFVHAQSDPAPFTVNPASGAIVTVQPIYASAGNVTVTGSATNGSQSALRVSVYDGVGADAPYVGDVSMGDKSLSATAAPGSFVLILNSRMLAEGPHTLRFEAHFSGATATTTAFLDVQNMQPYQPADTSSDDQN